MDQWIFHSLSLVVGICGGFIGAYVGMKVGITKLEVHMDDVRQRLDKVASVVNVHNDDILIHDVELEDVMRKLDLPRKRRQAWRFET